MAISSAGVGSGLNVQSIVSQLVAVEQQPIKLLQAKGSVLQTKLSVFGQIKSGLSALQDAARALTSSSTWTSKSFTSSANTLVTGSATSNASAGSFSVNVVNLSSTQSGTIKMAAGYSAPVAYTLQIQQGQRVVAGDSFTPGASSPVTVDVEAGDTLQDIANSINAKSATAGVSASVINAADGSQYLALRGSNTGLNAGFQLSSVVSGTDITPNTVANGLLTEVEDNDPLTPRVFAAVGTWETTQYAVDSKVKIDGIEVTSSNNTVKDAVTGVTLNLLGTTTSPVSISVNTDKADIKAKIQAFQDAYNKLYADLKTQTAYNAATKKGGPLLGDNTAIGLQNMLRLMVAGNVPAPSTISRLSDLGLEVQADGSLKTNMTKLDAALQNPENVQVFFSQSTGSASSNGIAKRFYDFAFGALSTDGTVTTRTQGFQKAIEQNNKTIDRANMRIEAYQAQLLRQYNTLDANMGKLNGLSSYVSSQIAQWNKG